MNTTPDFREVEHLFPHGYQFIRLRERSKKPLGTWRAVPSLTEAEAREHMEAGANIGVRLRTIDLVIDVDPRNGGDNSLAELEWELQTDFQNYPRVKTPGGGFHIYMSLPDGIEIRRSINGHPGIDIKTIGGYVVAPGAIHPNGGMYMWAQTPRLPVARAPRDLLDLLVRDIQPVLAEDAEWTPEMLSEVLAHLDPLEFREYDQWFRLMSACHEVTCGAGSDEFVTWSTSDEMYSGDEKRIRMHWNSLKAGKPNNVGLGTFRKILIEHGVRDIPGEPASVDFADVKEESLIERPTVHVSGGSLPSNVRDAERYLAAASLRDPANGVFQRAGILVSIARLSAATARDGIRRAAGTLQITPMRVEILRRKLTETVRWVRYDKRSRKQVEIDAPTDATRALLEGHDIWDNTPRLTGIIEVPTLRSDGRTLDCSGYDNESGLYLAPSDVFPKIPECPTKEDASTALDRLLKILKDFPFTSEASRSVAVALLITPLVRHSIRTAPMFAITAPRPSSGKTLLATLAGYIASGRTPSLISQPRTPEEEEKKILALLLEGSPVTVIDNCESSLRGETLCTVLTEPEFRGRILGVTRTVVVPTATTWVATGNNLVIEGDLSSRSLLCALDPNDERPEERSFSINLHEDIPRRRGELVVAALTIVKGYLGAGAPLTDLPTFGRFEKWSRFVREPLVWVGMTDPCDSRRMIESDDPVRNQLGNILEAWWAAFGPAPRTATEVIDVALSNSMGGPSEALHTAVYEIAEDRGRINHRRFGKYVSRHENRIERGLRFQKSGTRSGATLWTVTKMKNSEEVTG